MCRSIGQYATHHSSNPVSGHAKIKIAPHRGGMDASCISSAQPNETGTIFRGSAAFGCQLLGATQQLTTACWAPVSFVHHTQAKQGMTRGRGDDGSGSESKGEAKGETVVFDLLDKVQVIMTGQMKL